MKLFAGLPVLYTGIASNSIRQRDYRTHFNGSAGRSTLRKSLGVLFKYSLVPRDSDLATGKTKFCGADEKILTKWMHENLVLFFYATSHYNKLEGILIQHLNPPLNLQGCYAEENRDFRAMLSALRSYKKALSSR